MAAATPQALAAVKAIKHARQWGPFATRRFVERNDIPLHLLLSVAKFEARRRINAKVAS